MLKLPLRNFAGQYCGSDFSREAIGFLFWFSKEEGNSFATKVAPTWVLALLDARLFADAKGTENHPEQVVVAIGAG